MTRPQTTEAAEYYFKYIDLITSDEIVPAFKNQFGQTVQFLKGISEAQSLKSYAQGKWTIREVLNHVNDCERVFLGRAFWFARGFQDALPEPLQACPQPWRGEPGEADRLASSRFMVPLRDPRVFGRPPHLPLPPVPGVVGRLQHTGVPLDLKCDAAHRVR